MFFLLMGGIALFLEEPQSPIRGAALFIVTYLLWGLHLSTTIFPNKVIKKRGWLFPHFTSEYNQLERIELRSSYIHQSGYGAHSHYALYVGVINGPYNSFINLSWGVKNSESADSYVDFVNQLQQLTGLPVQIDQAFYTQFKHKFGAEYPSVETQPSSH